MKTNSKRKVFGDAVDLLMGDMEEVTMPRGVQMVPVKSIQPFHDHPFHLYGIKRRMNQMRMSYNKLWKLLIDKKMKKSDLRKNAKISSSTLAKLTNDENVTTDVLVRICNELKCNVSDIMEFIPDEESEENI